MCAHRIDHNYYLFASLQQPQCRRLNSSLGTGAYQNKLVGTNIAQQPFYSRLIERVHAPLMENNLPASTHYIDW
jgi:hypothetical protein